MAPPTTQKSPQQHEEKLTQKPIQKPIRPAMLKHDSSGSSSSTTGRESLGITRPRRQKRLKSVTQACHLCRRFKARCDGARPSCSSCRSKDRECRYEGEEGQSLQAAMKSRLESLERIVAALQTTSPGEANQLLSRIRSAEDIDTVMPPVDHLPPEIPSYLASSLPVNMTSTTQLRHNGSSFLINLTIPSAQFTSAAVQSFFGSSGKLFHVFSRQQIERYHKGVYGLDGQPNVNNQVAICGLAAVAAVGITYNPTDFDKGSEVAFYDVAKHYFASVVEEHPLDAIKVCTLLAQYKLMRKATASLAYVEAGLNLSRRHSLHIGECRPSSLAEDEWIDYRRAWRTLLFLSGWLSSTLGYISGNDDSAFEKLVPLAEVEVDHRSTISECVQAEMTKISLINGEILRMHLTQPELTAENMDSIIRTLRDWHKQIPPQMLLGNLAGQTLADETRRSIYHAHLLYLGALILVYRRIASQAAQTLLFQQRQSGFVTDDAAGKTTGIGGDMTVVLDQVTRSRAWDGIVAARYSASILGLLLAEKGIFKRCWLVIFQAHTSCVVLLHSIVQKQLHKMSPPLWTEDMRLARVCLDTLEYCGEIDPVASKFQIRLSGIYMKLQNISEQLINAALLADSLHMRGENGNSAITTSEVARRQRTEDWVEVPPDFVPSDDESNPSSYQHPVSPGGPSGVKPTQEPSSPNYLLTIPLGSDSKLVELSFALLFALCRPWGERPPQDKQQQQVENPSANTNLNANTNNYHHTVDPRSDSYDHNSSYASTTTSTHFTRTTTTNSLNTATHPSSLSQSMMQAWERENNTTPHAHALPTVSLQPPPPPPPSEWDSSTTPRFTWDTVSMLGLQPSSSTPNTTGCNLTTPASIISGDTKPSGVPLTPSEATHCGVLTGGIPVPGPPGPIQMPRGSLFLGSETPSGWEAAADIWVEGEDDGGDEMEGEMEGVGVVEVLA